MLKRAVDLLRAPSKEQMLTARRWGLRVEWYGLEIPVNYSVLYYCTYWSTSQSFVKTAPATSSHIFQSCQLSSPLSCPTGHRTDAISKHDVTFPSRNERDYCTIDCRLPVVSWHNSIALKHLLVQRWSFEFSISWSLLPDSYRSITLPQSCSIALYPVVRRALLNYYIRPILEHYDDPRLGNKECSVVLLACDST